VRFLDTSRIRTRLDERVRAHDGTELSVDLYLPPDPGRYPVLVSRTVADNNRGGRSGISSPPAERWKSYAAQGYIVAACDVRGRGDSDGQYIPFVNEAADGAATVAWLRGFDECNGRIGLFGSGYGAFCAWAACVSDRHVDAIVSISPLGAVGEGLVHRGGAARLEWLFWMHLFGGHVLQPANVPRWKAIYRHWPLRSMDEALGRRDIWWREWLDHLDSKDPFWLPLDLADQITTLTVPGLHVTGWWDAQAAACHYYYEAASRSAAPQELIVGPWDTAATRRPSSHVGGFDFGPRSVIDLDEIMIGFFDTLLQLPTQDVSFNPAAHRDHRSAKERGGRKRLFISGRNEWLNLTARDLECGQIMELHLRSNNGANTRRGDGLLATAVHNVRSTDVITHNPKVPIEFQPLFASFASGANPLGFTLDQAHLTCRDEALVYTGLPLKRAVTVVGEPTVTLTVITTAQDADIFVLLSDAFPLGTRDLHLAHGVVRLATLPSFQPGTPVKLVLKLDRIAHDFLPGHQVRLTVTPSLYPLYACNPHIRGYAEAVDSAIADIELLHGPDDPAFLMLPLAGSPLQLA